MAASPAATAGATRPGHQALTVAFFAYVLVTWGALCVFIFARQPVLGGDFMQFYVIGGLALRGDWALQYDWPAVHALQVQLLPASAPYYYAPAYPPLVAALYAPFAALPFPWAFGTWALATGGLYAWLVSLCARACTVLRRAHVLLAALVFPPFIALVIMGQSSLWPLAGFVGGWWALDRGRPVLAGLLLALVSLKPHFGVALAFVVVLTQSWRLLAGLIIGIAVHAALAAGIAGVDAVQAWFAAAMGALRNPGAFDPVDARHTHALRAAVAALAPERVATGVWLAVLGVSVWLTVRVWRADRSWALRFAALLLAAILASPHVLAYDGVLLVPVVVWLLDRAIRLRQYDVIVSLVGVSIAFVAPPARIAGIPITIPLMAWLLWRCGAGREAIGAVRPEAALP